MFQVLVQFRHSSFSSSS